MKPRVRIRAFAPRDYDDVIALWRECGLTPKRSDALPEIEKLLTLPSNSFLVGEVANDDSPARVVATVIGAWDGRRGWVYRLVVKASARRSGIGTQMMRTIEEALRRKGATKINLLVEPGNEAAAAFYRALGYSSEPFQFFFKNCDPEAYSGEDA